MSPRLNERAVKRWLRDQQAAQQKEDEERVRVLLDLTEDKALRLYLAMPLSREEVTSEPSPLLWIMRRVLEQSRPVRGRKR
ncbi:MAG TPA: hypothetical protein VNM72_02040 [Blastocatellia bacterium]|nr:hypothetical protein [Blastocatellia bacterium]